MVKATYLTVLGVLGLTAVGMSGARAADDPAGYWATEKNESQIHITHCGGDKICGTIFWMKDPNDAKGNLKLDKENEDEAKRKRSLLGLQLINMKADDEDLWKGTVYNPQNGKTYDATLKILSDKEVELKGCVAYILCGGQKWKREDAKTVNTAEGAKTTAAAPPSVHTAAPAHKLVPAAAPASEKPADP